jgi:hypothetical protein
LEFLSSGLDQCVACLGDNDCDDALLRNGAETCTTGVCRAGPPPGEDRDDDPDQCVACLDDGDCLD